MYLTIGGGVILSHKKMQYNCSKKMFSGRTKPFRVIGDPDSQRPVKRSSNVVAVRTADRYRKGI